MASHPGSANERTASAIAIGGRKLVGRAIELAEIARRLGEGERWLTFVGPPGVGKTRLAIEAARAAERDRGLVALWASLGGHVAGDDVIAAVAGLLGVSAAAREPAARVGQLLQGRGPLLLVLDDADRLAAELGPIVETWLARAPELHLIVTSRMRLGRDEERVVDVAPLPVEDAVTLFDLRSRASRRERRAGGASADVTRRLCEQLDCLPLAIELAAARTAVLPAQKLLARLEQRADEVLRAGAAPFTERAAPGRHASLAAAIEVSWQLLGDEERETLAQCAAFSGSFSLEAAEAVVRGGGAALDALPALCERSLVERLEIASIEGEIRFRLYASVRAFARRSLDETGRRAEVEQRIFDHVIDECERLVIGLEGPHAREMEQRLDLEREELLAAHRSASPATAARAGLVLAELSALRGVSSTALYETTVRAARASGDDRLVARCLTAFAVAAARLGFVDEPRRALDEALAIAEKLRDDDVHGRVLLARGRYRAQHGAFDDAEADLAHAASILERADVPFALAAVKNIEGCVAEIRGDYAGAVRAFEASRAGFRRAGSARMEAAVLGNLGVVRHAEGRREDSRKLYEEALALAQSTNNLAIEADARMNLGSWYLGEGDLDRSEQHSRVALGLERRLGNRRFEGVVVANLAMVAHDRGELPAARDLYQNALAILRECGEARFLSMVIPFAAAAEASLGLLLEARDDFAAARRGPSGMDAAWSRVVDTLEGLLALAEARAAPSREEAENEARARLARARAQLDEGPRAPRRPELALAARLLARALGEGPAPAPTKAADEPGLVLAIGRDQRWFSLAGGPRVDLSKRGPLRLILRALVEQRQGAPGIGVAAEQLFQAGWPGQRALPHAAQNRVYSAIRTLRRLGLEPVLARHDDGYLLDPAVSVAKNRG